MALFIISNYDFKDTLLKNKIRLRYEEEYVLYNITILTFYDAGM